MLAISIGLHAAIALALVSLQRGSVPEPTDQQVALIWSEQAPGAGDAVDASMQSAQALPPEEPVTPPSPEAAITPAEPGAEPEVLAPPMVHDPLPVPEPLVEETTPLPPPPAPPVPPRPPEPASRQRAAAPPAATGAAAATAPMAQGAGQALGSVVPARLRPGVVNAPPAYPQASRLRNEQGRVTLQVEIDPLGRVADVRVMLSSGFPALDQAAMEAVRRWRFDAAQRDGLPVLSTTAIGITFQLEGDRRW
ncbi:energy transducer TonB [Falsiroseomonas sp.]|uniref:energy transducer TonB n=1 Tax=Falsiroseomonas sp. TaxID=2870721 RepID=UPI0027350D98|nr:energy transducer TonB [Falsiroseomonas sp.]MDP3415203.1 energy transducer TonB [Falsiroseomonas sp.]